MKAGAVLAVAVGVGAALCVSGCGEQPQTATQRKVDATAYSGSTVSGFTEPGWKAGDKISWESQMRERNKGQNEYGR
ncbi:MAG: hypothetical protein FJY26_04220 [Betaproteobacteria bacterium]|nr:hypothetical protein [Betaproteobacteria bacterium]